MKIRLRILFLIVGINAGALIIIFLIAEFRQEARGQETRREARESYQKWADWLGYQHGLLEPVVRSLPEPGYYLLDPSLRRTVAVPWDGADPTHPLPWFFTNDGETLTAWFHYGGQEASSDYRIGFPVNSEWLDASEVQLGITPVLIANDSRENAGSLTTFELPGADGRPVGDVYFLDTPRKSDSLFPDIFPLISILFLIILLTISLLTYWGLIRPIDTLDRALRRGDRSPLRRLRGLTGEVSFLARAIDELYEIQENLKSEIALRHAAEEELRRREADITTLYNEREKLQRDLHDDIIQHLFALGLAMESGKHPESTGIRKSLNEVINRLRAFLEDGHATSGPETLSQAVDSLVTAFSRNGGTRIDYRIGPQADSAFSDHVPEVKLILTEAISNAIRHGRPEKIRIEFTQENSADLLSISDNGTGCRLENTPIERGLRNMQERASEIGATVTYTSQPGEGFTVMLRKPHQIVT